MLVDWVDQKVLPPLGHSFEWNRVEGLGPETLSGVRHVHLVPDGHWSARMAFSVQSSEQQREYESLLARLNGMVNTVDIPVPLNRVPARAAQSSLVGPHLAGSFRAVIARTDWADADILPGQIIGIGGVCHQVLAVNPGHADGIELQLRNPLTRDLLPDAGVELITNGAFATDISGWTPAVTGSSTVTHASGRMRLERISGASCRVWQGFATIPGRRYRAAFETDGSLSAWIGVQAQGTELLSVAFSGAAVRSLHFIARTFTTFITFAANADGQHHVDDVSSAEDAGAIVTSRPKCRMRLSSSPGETYYELHKFAMPQLAFIEDMFDAGAL